MSKRRKKAAKSRRRPKAKRPASPRGADATRLALANLAHDIRTPLTGMLALSELLLVSDLPERERRWAETMKDAAGHLARLTSLVVEAGRSGGGKLTLQAEPFALPDFVEAVAQSLRARAEGKSLGVDIAIADDLPDRVNADVVRLRSALENLIDNAVKFTERGRVSFAVAAAKAPRGWLQLTFTVADTGIGIIAADLKKLFRPFAQANPGVTQQFGGSGLGLAFARRIARSMGGDLTVKSSPGRGSTFQLVALVEPAAPDPNVAAKTIKPAQSLRVLCVEDNPYGRVILHTVLGELGHRVGFAETGEAAIAAVDSGNYDVVLMDIALPGMDGLETARRIRALPGAPGGTPIIGVSGRTGNEDEVAAWDAGMETYLRKPASPATLNAVLAAVAARIDRNRR